MYAYANSNITKRKTLSKDYNTSISGKNKVTQEY